MNRVAMCQVRSMGKTIAKQKKKKSTVVKNQKKKDCDKSHLAPNEKTQPIQWTERPTSALVAVGSLWPWVQGLVNKYLITRNNINGANLCGQYFVVWQF